MVKQQGTRLTDVVLAKPLAPGANPSYQDGKFLGEKNGLLASLNSTARLEYTIALDGISNTQNHQP